MNLSELHLLRPQWLLALVPLALLLWRLTRHGRDAGAWRGLVDPHLLPHLLVSSRSGSGRTARVLLGVGALLLVLALAGPTWERLPQPLYQPQQYRVLLLDISRQMNAADVPPSRLAQARFETLDLLKRSDEGQTALIAYGAEPYIISPLTRDAETIALQVPGLSSDLLPLQGRNAAPALERALTLLQNAGARNGDVILITGGMDDPAAAQAAARTLRQAGHRLSVLAVGTEAGAPVPSADGGFLQDAGGAILLPRLDPDALSALARAGGGHYVQSRPDDRDLEGLIREPGTGDSVEQQDQEIRSDQWRELGPWLLLALLPIAALAFRRGWFSPLLPALLTLFLLLPTRPATAFGWDDLWARPDQRGARALARAQPEQAAELFRDPAWRAAARYRSGDYPLALKELEATSGERADYNRGNTLARMGKLQEAIDAYDRVLERDPQHEDARFNRDLLQRLLQSQPPPQQQSGENQESDESGEEGDSEQQQGGESSGGGSADQATREPQGSGDGESQDRDQGSEQTGEQGQEPPDAKPSQGEENADSEANDSKDRQAQATPKPADQGKSEPPAEPGRSDLLGGDEPDGEATASAGVQPKEAPIPESEQAMEQWLRRVPDDPAGLLRQRILLQHLRYRGDLP